MRRIVWFAATAAALTIAGAGVSAPAARCQQQDAKPSSDQPAAGQTSQGGSQSTSQSGQSSGASSTDTSAPAPGSTTMTQSSKPPQESLGEAARRAREQKKEAGKPARTFNNDNIPAAGGISTVGEKAEAPAEGAAADGSAPAAENKGAAGDEQAWRARFAKLRETLAADQHDLEVMQRELSVLDVVNYPDPQKTLQQETTRGDINKKTADIEKQKKKIEADQQAIADAQDDLRKSGGDSGWAR